VAFRGHSKRAINYEGEELWFKSIDHGSSSVKTARFGGAFAAIRYPDQEGELKPMEQNHIDHIGEWRPEGDFYVDPDTTVRGLTIPPSTIPGRSGDFYVEPDTTVRGLTIPPSTIPGGFLPGAAGDPKSSHELLDHNIWDIYKGAGLSDGDFYREPFDHKEFLMQKLHPGQSSDLSSSREPKTARFSDATAPPAPPAIPTDPYFKLEPTTLYVTSSAPHTIGNVLLDFFEFEVPSTFQKVNRTKFSIKADVFDKFVMSTIKVKVFAQEKTRFAIEFQYRKGDRMAFNNTYQKATNHVKGAKGIELVGGAVERPAICLAPPQLPEGMAIDIGEADFTPLLDMATQTCTPSLQAEAAVALAELAEDDAVAPRLCTERVFQEITKLFGSGANEVAYPAANLANKLARRQESAPYVAEQGILPLMLDKVRSTATHSLVRDELSQAVKAAAEWQSSTTLSQTNLFQLAQSLHECSEEMEVMGNSKVAQNLRSARFALSA
jgi:hypothetical protein